MSRLFFLLFQETDVKAGNQRSTAAVSFNTISPAKKKKTKKG